MTQETVSAHCPKCGAPIPADAAEGLCPRCLLRAAGAPTEAGNPSAGGGNSPALDQVVRAFPDLEIAGLIGVGGMGAVYRARQPKLDRFVALKVLPESLARDPAFAERFLREARVLARLNHPNVVTVHDFGQAGGFFYLLMEYVDGVNLRQAMRAARFTPAQALAMVPSVCEALQYAHEEGVLHRDIKPENILLDTRGRVKIADFGIAKIMGQSGDQPTLTTHGAALGTPHYMAPEQVETPTDVDHRADIYSLGVVLYELLTGELPLGRFAPPSAKTDLDARVDAIVLRALTKERELRQQSAREVRTEIDRVTRVGSPDASARAAKLTPAHPEPPLWRLPLLARQSIQWLLLAVLATSVYVVASQWTHWQRMVFDLLTRSWQSGMATGVCLAGLLWLALGWFPSQWRHWNMPPSGSSAFVDRILRLLVFCLFALTAYSVGSGVLIQTGSVYIGGGAMLRNTILTLTNLAAMTVPLWLFWRYERGRSAFHTPERLPAWAHRVAAGLAAATLVSTCSRLFLHAQSGPNVVVLSGPSEQWLLAALAIWTGNRWWRAAALALNLPMAVGGLGSSAWLALLLLQGRASTIYGTITGDHMTMVSTFPREYVVLQALVPLGSIAALVLLWHPEVKAAFGIPTRPFRATVGTAADPVRVP